MSRYIDAEQIVYTWLIDNDGKEHDGVTLQSVIDMMPTADVVEVVRCKDCRKWKTALCPFGDSVLDYNKEDGYCNYGERAEA